MAASLAISFDEEILETADDRNAGEEHGDPDDEEHGLHALLMRDGFDPLPSPT